MQFRLFKLRYRRVFRKKQRQVEDLGQQAEAGLERNFFRRLGNLREVWRFVVGWVGLLVLILAYQVAQLEGLSRHYQSQQPVPGGTYTEALQGRFTNANPLFAASEVDASVSKLLFAGLFTFDTHNKLTGDLAQSYDVDARGTLYTVHLRHDLTWHDGEALTADDVVFTYNTLQNPDVQSPLLSSWQGVKVAAVNPTTVTFALTNPLASFPYNLTNGIVPKHLLAKYPASDLRSIDFNTVHPVGAGPFEWSALQVKNAGTTKSEVLIALHPFAGYHTGRPKLNGFVVDVFNDKDSLASAFHKGQVNGVAGLQSPSQLGDGKDKGMQTYNLLLTAANMAFFNTASPVLSDTKIRQALVQASNVPSLVRKLDYPTRTVTEPLLNNQLGFDRAYAQAAYNPKNAAAILDQAGWLPGKNGIRAKDGKPLVLRVAGADTPENRLVTDALTYTWRAVGMNANVSLQNDSELRGTISSHDYDVLLYGISIGVDPDVYVYWHSSQTDPRSTRLNLSLYKSAAADSGLDAGRTRQDALLRTIKYRGFLQAWQADAPALGLYQPRFLYLTNEKVYGLDQQSINTGIDRFDNVSNWQVRTANVTNPN